MKYKILPWTKSEAKKILERRLKGAKEYRKMLLEPEWAMCRNSIFDDPDLYANLTSGLEAGDTEDFDLGSRIDVKYAFRNYRLVHSHMSANPPVATARPQSQDQEDRRAARAAGQVMRWFFSTEDMHDKNDLVNVDLLSTGTGISKVLLDKGEGDIVSFDKEKMEVELEGRIKLVKVPVDFIWIDPNAKTQDDVKYIFELVQMSISEIKSCMPNKVAMIRKSATTNKTYDPRSETMSGILGSGGETGASDNGIDTLYNLYHYYEVGLPENGMLGRYCMLTDDGTVISDLSISPCLSYPAPDLKERKKARQEGRTPERGVPKAYLPYQIITDIDMPDRVYGRSSLFYVVPAQNLMSNLDSAMAEAMKAHGVVRLLLPEGAQLGKDAVGNSSVEIIPIKNTGDGEIKFMQPAGLPAAMTELRANMKMGVDDMWGVNDNMFGQSEREQSGYQMQYAVNQGYLIRKRLFNKSVRFVRAQYMALMAHVIQHWSVPKALSVLGEESGSDVVELMGMDIFGGYEVDVEYGTHLPLDPMARRDDLIKYMPILEQAGVSKKSIASALKFADLEYVQSIGELSRDRAKEIIDYITVKHIQAEPTSKHEDHEGIVAYLLEYVNTADFKHLSDKIRALIDEHIDMRVQLAAQNAATAAPVPGGPGEATGPVPGMPPGPPPPPMIPPPPV